MLYLKQTAKTVQTAFEDLQAALGEHGFGLLHHYDFRQTLAGKGFTLGNECLVLEVCNPRQACAVLDQDMKLNLVLPCRMSIFQQDGKTLIGMVPPGELLALVSHSPAIAQAADEVERSMRAIIDQAA